MRVIELLFVLWVFSASLAAEGRHAPGLANQGGDTNPGNMYYSDGFYYYSPIPGTPFYYPMPIPGVPNQQMIPPFKLPWNPLPRISQSPSPPTASPPPPPNTVAPPPEGSPSPPINRSKECWGATSSSTSCSNHVCCTTIVYTGTTDCSTGTPRPYRKVEQHCSPQTGP